MKDDVPLEWQFRLEGEGISVANVMRMLRYFEVNCSTVNFKSVSDLPKIKGSALVIDKTMASTKFFEQIEAIKDYKGTIICSDRSLYQVIKHRIPEYVCQLDNSFLCVDFFDRPDVKAVMDKVTAVFSVTTNTLTIRHWHGPRVFFVPYLGNMTRDMMNLTGCPVMETGGQVASFAWLLAYNLGANPIGVFGVTHGYDSMAETEYPAGTPHKRIKGKYGAVWQDPVYEYYNGTFLDFIRIGRENEVTTVNTTKSGALYSKDVVDMALKEFVEKNK
jgi:hypothetical protein